MDALKFNKGDILYDNKGDLVRLVMGCNLLQQFYVLMLADLPNEEYICAAYDMHYVDSLEKIGEL